MRYLSFLGIGKNVKQCAFIMHTAQDTFMAHVFHCEPSSGALCKTIEAACKVISIQCITVNVDIKYFHCIAAALPKVFRCTSTGSR